MVMVDEIVDEERTDTSLADTKGTDVPAAKRVAVGHATALAGLTLQVVLQFAGKSEGIFVANVCSGWRKSYASTFDGRLRTHRAAGVMSIQRVKWLWSEPLSENTVIHLYGHKNQSPSWYVGRYAPRVVVEEAILDKSIFLGKQHLMQGIAASGRVNLLSDLWYDYFLIQPHLLGYDASKLLVDAAQGGHLLALARVWYLLEPDQPHCGREAVKSAVEHGHLAVIEFFFRTDWWSSLDGPLNLAPLAAAHNQISVLRWLPAHGHGWNTVTALAAGEKGSVGTLNFLLENGCPGMDQRLVGCCVQHERLDALQWCYDTLRPRAPYVWTPANLQDCLLLAGTFDRQNSAKFLLEHGAEWPDIGQVFGEDITAYNHCGDYEYVFCTRTCIWSPSFLEWAMTEGCTLDTWTTATCARLASITEWESDCPFLEMLAFAHARGSPCVCARNVPDF